MPKRPVQDAQSLASERENQQVENEHLFSALLRQEEGVVSPLLKKIGADPGALSASTEKELAKAPHVSGGQIYMSPLLSKVSRSRLKKKPAR